MIATRDPRELRLLFIGMDWQRKGGPVALAVTRELNRMNIPAGLTVIGCNPLLDEADLRTVTLPETAAAIGKSIAELQMRTQCGASIIAIRRGEKTRHNPEPRFILAAGDELLLLGDADQLMAGESLLKGS